MSSKLEVDRSSGFWCRDASLHDLWNILGHPLIARFDPPPSYTILSVRRIPTGLVPINNRQNARRMFAFRRDQNVTSVKVAVDEADGGHRGGCSAADGYRSVVGIA